MTDKEIKYKAEELAEQVGHYHRQYAYPSAAVETCILRALTEVRDACFGPIHDETMANVERALHDERS